jgi:NADH-quinone oxidoreductase subunit N
MSTLSKLRFITGDKFSLVSISFIIFFVLIFIKIAIDSLDKQLELNTIFLLTVSIATLSVLVQLTDIFVIYFGIVVLSLCLYPLLALHKKSQGNVEAASKYFFLGSLGSGIMLYGVSLIYRELNSLNYKDIKQISIAFYTINNHSYSLTVGFIFIMFGFFFKLSIVPLQN